jgi:hypothetical protein
MEKVPNRKIVAVKFSWAWFAYTWLSGSEGLVLKFGAS